MYSGIFTIGPLGPCPPMNCEKYRISKNATLEKLSQLKTVVTRCQILRLNCTKFDFGWGFTLGPAAGAYSAAPDHLAGFLGSYY